jgi:lambda repressor-like predicted transcriptional regulator
MIANRAQEDAMQEARHPNRLTALIKEAGLTVREIARETNLPEGTLRHYAAGDFVIPKNIRAVLAQMIGCDIEDLAPLYAPQRKPIVERNVIGPSPDRWELSHRMTDKRAKDSSSFEERDGCFSFGRLKTTWKVLDGDGIRSYLPQNISSHYIPFAEELPEELQARRNQIQAEQEQKKEQGFPYLWNGEIYNLDRFVIGREPIHEDMTLDLWFRPSDYYTYLATNMSLKDQEMRKKYLQDVDWHETIPYFSHSFGVSLAAITSDGYTIFTHRGKNVGTLPSTYETSIVEGLSRPIDRGTGGEAPDIYRCACRGLAEELGLREAIDFSVSDIAFLSFGVSTQYALWALRGMVNIKRSVSELVALWDNGVRDKFENQDVIPVPFTPEDVISFVFTHESYSLKPTLYHVLVHEFGREKVDKTIASY